MWLIFDSKKPGHMPRLNYHPALTGTMSPDDRGNGLEDKAA